MELMAGVDNTGLGVDACGLEYSDTHLVFKEENKWIDRID